MQRIIILIFTNLLSVYAYAQIESPHSTGVRAPRPVNAMLVKNKVKTMQIACTDGSKDIHWFDEQGNITATVTQQPAPFHTKDSSNRVNTYDENKRLVQYKLLRNDTILAIDTLIYNKNGSLTDRRGTRFDFYRSTLNYSIEYRYDDHGRLKEEIMRFGQRRGSNESEPFSVNHFVYDDEGKLVRIDTKYPEVSYTYDRKGRLREATWYITDINSSIPETKILERCSYRYKRNGLVKRFVYHDRGLLFEEEHKKKYKIRYTYYN